MKKILLVCSAGMSTSIVVKKMQEAADAQGVEAKIWAVGDALAKENAGEADCILLGPQVKFLLGKMEEIANGKPVAVIDMRNYGMMNGQAILDQAIELIG